MPQTRLANLSWLDLNDLIEDGVLGQIERVRNRGTVTADFVTDEEVVKLGQGMRPDDDLMDSPALVDYRNQ